MAYPSKGIALKRSWKETRIYVKITNTRAKRGGNMIYHDIYLEQAVSRKEHKLNNIYTVFCAVMIAWLFFLEVATLNLAFSVFIIIFILLIVVLQQTKKVDFDYSYTNGEFEVDKIIGGSKRKNLLSVNVEQIVVLAPAKTEPVMPYVGRRMKTLDCTSHDQVPYYTMIVKNPQTEEEWKVLLELNEEFLNEFKRKLGTKVHI